MKLQQVITSLTLLATMTVGQIVNIKVDNTKQSSLTSISIGVQPASAGHYMDDYFRTGTVVSFLQNGLSLNLHYFKNGGMIQSSKTDNNDEDQQFEVLRKPGTNIVQFRRINSNMLITPSTFGNLAVLEAWEQSIRSPFHANQSWYIDEANVPGTFWIKPLGAPNMAMNLPLGKNNVKSTLFNFDRNDPDQRWGLKIHSYPQGNVQPVVVQSTKVVPPVVTPKKVYPVLDGVIKDENIKYTAVLISARAGAFKQSPAKVGHTIFAAVKRWDRKYYSLYSDGSMVQKHLEPMEETTTVSSPGPQVKLDFNAVRIDFGGLDNDLLNKWKSAGNSPRLDGYSFRTLSISDEQYRRSIPKSKGGYNSSYRTLGCATYDIFASNGCNCTTVSLKMFKIATGENFTEWNPTHLAQSIDKSNWLGDWYSFKLPISF